MEDGTSKLREMRSLHDELRTISQNAKENPIPGEAMIASTCAVIQANSAAIFANAVAKGWHDQDPYEEVPAKLLMIHSEVTEAVEDLRESRSIADLRVVEFEPDGKPIGFPVELADALIRILDLGASLNIDLGVSVVLKMAYNTGRPYRHGGKKL